MGHTAPFARVAAAALVAAFLPSGASSQPTIARDRAPAVPGSIRPFVDRLYSADPHARAEAACEIGRRHTDAAAAIPILLSMLSDDIVVRAINCEMSNWARNLLATSPDVQQWSRTSPAREAAEALGDIGEAAVPGLLRALGHADWKTRKFAAYGLGEAEPVNARAAVVKALGERLRDAHPEVRDRSAWALGEIEDAAAVTALSSALGDSDTRVRATAVWALGEIEDPSSVPGLLGALRDADASVREKAAWALGEVEDGSAVDALVAATKDSSPGVRRKAVWALGEIEDPAAIGGLAKALSDGDAQVRRQAAWALGEIEDAGAVPALTRALADGDWQVRKMAAWALGEIEDPSALGALRGAAGDSNSEVRRAIASAIRELRGK